MAKIIEEAFDLNQESPDVTQVNTTANLWGDLFLYQVPTGMAHILKPEHTFGAYLKDTGGSVEADTTQVKIEVRDTAQIDRKTIFGPAIYKTVQEFQDRDLIAHLNVRELIHVREKMYIAVMVKAAVACSKDTSYFNLAINRIRQTL